MANPVAPEDGSARKIPYWEDEAHQGTPYLPLGDGHIDMGAGRSLGTIPGASLNGRVSGGLRAFGYFPDTFKPFDLTAVTTEQLIWDPASGKKFRLLGAILTADAATNIEFLDGTGGSVIYRVGLAIGVPQSLDLGMIGILSGAANANLYVTSSNSAAIFGTVWGCEQ